MSELGPLIEQAESFRIRGDTSSAINIAKAQSSITHEQIVHTPDEELFEFMQLWRIWIESLLDSSQISGSNVDSEILQSTQEVIAVYYYDEYAWEIAKKIKSDSKGNEYQMAAEMCRDEGWLHFYMYKLTHNPRELELAMESLDEALELATAGTHAYIVTLSDRELWQKETGT